MVAAIEQKNIQQKSIAQEIAEIVVHDLPWTEEMYFRVSEVNHLIELSDGKLVLHDMPIPRHQRIVKRLARSLDQWVEDNKLGEILFAPMPVRLWEGKIREPDIMFYSNDHSERIKEKYGEAPDIAVEIVSEDSIQRDRKEKMQEYAAAVVLEYWIVDPVKNTIDIHSLSKEKYNLQKTFSSNQTLTSKIFPNLEIHLKQIFK